MPDNPYLQWPVFRRSVVAAFQRSLTRRVADADYIAARIACRAQLPVQFLWASQQALEKDPKSILFLHRIEADNVGHDIRAALSLIAQSGLDLGLSVGSMTFIREVADIGEYRYRA